MSLYASGDVIWQKSTLDRVNTSHPMLYQNVLGSKAPAVMPTKSLKASIIALQKTVVPQFEHLDIIVWMSVFFNTKRYQVLYLKTWLDQFIINRNTKSYTRPQLAISAMKKRNLSRFASSWVTNRPTKASTRMYIWHAFLLTLTHLT